MRLMLNFTIPAAKGNQASADGTMQTALKTLIEASKAEQAYFYLSDGKRAGTIIFEAENQSQMGMLNEPLFAALEAEISIQPVLNMDDLAKAI